MLYCPLRLPLSASKRLPGGERRKSNVCAASSCASFRIAIFAMPENLLHLPVSNNACVSALRKLLITYSDYNELRWAARLFFVTGQSAIQSQPPASWAQLPDRRGGPTRRPSPSPLRPDPD